MTARTTPALLEREAELEELQAALEAASRGTGSLVVVEGPAGIGKTRLLASARETAERTGLRVLSARGTELERDFPFALVGQLFGPVVHEASEAEREELLDATARLAGPVVGIESEGSPVDEDAGYLPDQSFEILNALYWLTSNLGERGPALLAVDDAHWSDQASLRFLIFLLPRLGELPVTLALTVRSGEGGPASELLAQLSSDPAAQVLRPAPLGGASVAELVRSGLAGEADDAFCAACQEVSGGNPFMLQELLLELRAEGSRGTEGEAARVRELAPASIQRAVLARLARLPEQSRALAERSRCSAMTLSRDRPGRSPDWTRRRPPLPRTRLAPPASSKPAGRCDSPTRSCATPCTRISPAPSGSPPTAGRRTCSRRAARGPSGSRSTGSRPTPTAIPRWSRRWARRRAAPSSTGPPRRRSAMSAGHWRSPQSQARGRICCAR